MGLVVKQFVKAPLKNNNYVVADEVSKEAVLIDCSCADDEIANWIQTEGLSLKYVLLTHGHFDHVLGVNYYKEHYGIESYLYKEDIPLLNRVNEYTQMLNFPTAEMPKVKTFDSNAVFGVGEYQIKVTLTPGHTQGGVCYLIDDKLFSGDTLFHGTCGRTDLLESDEQKMQQSLKMLFDKLADEISVYPGHGATTTIGHERWLY